MHQAEVTEILTQMIPPDWTKSRAFRFSLRLVFDPLILMISRLSPNPPKGFGEAVQAGDGRRGKGRVRS